MDDLKPEFGKRERFKRIKSYRERGDKLVIVWECVDHPGTTFEYDGDCPKCKKGITPEKWNDV